MCKLTASDEKYNVWMESTRILYSSKTEILHPGHYHHHHLPTRNHVQLQRQDVEIKAKQEATLMFLSAPGAELNVGVDRVFG